MVLALHLTLTVVDSAILMAHITRQQPPKAMPLQGWWTSITEVLCCIKHFSWVMHTKIDHDRSRRGSATCSSTYSGLLQHGEDTYSRPYTKVARCHVAYAVPAAVHSTQ